MWDNGNTIDGDGCSAACEEELTSIPTVSEWGLVILALMLLVLAKFYGIREREASLA